MRNEKLKDRLDDALSGIGENPWLLRQVLARAESEENKPVKKRISFGTVVIALLILVLMSVGIAAVTQWNVEDFLRDLEKADHFIAAPVRQDAETDNALLHVEAMVHDDHLLALDWRIENKHPEVPMYCWIEEFTVGGIPCRSADISNKPCCGFDETWLPGSVIDDDEDRYDGIAAGSEVVTYGYKTKSSEIYIKVNLYRPNRPVELIEWRDKTMDQELVNRKISEGCYVIPCGAYSGMEPEGYLKYETDDEEIGEGWVCYVSGHPAAEDAMGGMTVETLEIRLDAADQYISTPVQKKAETKDARVSVDSAAYTGNELAFDMTLENRNPENYLWFYLDELTVNGKKYDPDGFYETEDGAVNGSVNFYETWLPSWWYPDGTVQCGGYFLLSPEDAEKDTAHVALKVRVCRPERPAALFTLDFDDPGFKEELEKKIAEGYYVIPATAEDGPIRAVEGYFTPEADLEACPTGWAGAAGGYPSSDDGMGKIIEEYLEISFDVKKQKPEWEIFQLPTQESYENEYCTAVFDQAVVSEIGLRLALRIKPKKEDVLSDRVWLLTDQDGNSLTGIRYYPTERKAYPAPGHEGEVVWLCYWNMIRLNDLPDTFCLTTRLKNGDTISFPVKVR